MKTLSRTLIVAAITLLPGMAAAAPSVEQQRLAEALQLDPTRYTLTELSQIAAETNPADRAIRIQIIDKTHAAFKARVMNVLEEGGNIDDYEIVRSAR